MIVNPIIPIWIMALICIAIILINLKSGKYNIIRQIIISILIFMINLRIMIPYKGNENKITNELDVLFVIDNTISMVAEDYNQNMRRIDGVKKDCNYIIDNIPGAKFSVITFNNTSQILVPYTNDADTVRNSIETIQVIDSLYSKGSSLNVSLKDMKIMLESSAKKKNRKRIVFYISDGEITNDDSLESFSELKKYIDDGAVLGYGTDKGGYMKVSNYSNTFEYLKDNTSSEYPYPNAVSKIDEKNLKKLSNDMGIDYINMSKQSNIDKKLKQLDYGKNESSKKIDISLYKDTYYFFVIPLCLFLIYDVINFKRRIFNEKDHSNN